jgi:acetoin utilization deacetylase AcuC-like enzyme
MRAYYSDTFVLPLPDTHRFPMAKYRRLRERLITEHVLTSDELFVPAAAPRTDLILAHDPAWIDAVTAGGLPERTQRQIGFPWSPEMVERSRRSVGGTIAAGHQALIDGVAGNLAGGTHHAFRDRGEGYCVFNDVAVAARSMMRDNLVRRVAVVDCDVHQGNGTAAIFRDDPAVFTLSLHGENNFPFTKESSDIDTGLPDGTGDEEYLTTLRRQLTSVLERHRPDLVFYLAGADPFERDRLGRLALTIEGLRARDQMVFAACISRAIPVVVTMAGGYATDIDDIVTIHSKTIREAVSCATG